MKIIDMARRPGRYAFFCPACGFAHWFQIGHGHGWTWNNDRDNPSIQPSILSYADGFLCHSYVTDGRIRFLNDCTHDKAGQTMDLPDFPGTGEMDSDG